MKIVDEKRGNPSESVRNRTLSARQAQTIVAVLTSRSVEAGLRSVHVAKSTYYTWLADPIFKAEFDRKEREVAEEAMVSLKGLVPPALIALRHLLEKGKDAVRLRAAITVLERSASVLEMDKVLRRLEKVEEEMYELWETRKKRVGVD